MKFVVLVNTPKLMEYITILYGNFVNDSYNACTGNNCVAKDNFPTTMFEMDDKDIIIIIMSVCSWAVPARTSTVKTFKPFSSKTEHTYDLSHFERVVQVKIFPRTVVLCSCIMYITFV